MFREMRRKKQSLSQKEIDEVLNRGTSGVLAVFGDEGYPYTVPISYTYTNSKIYFHCAKKGHKLDAIKRNNKVSFCVIDQDDIYQKEYTTYFRSVIAFGTIQILENVCKKREGIEKLAEKYVPYDNMENRQIAIDREWNLLCVLEMTIDYMTGKESIELINKK